MQPENRNWVLIADEGIAEFYTRAGSRGPLARAFVLSSESQGGGDGSGAGETQRRSERNAPGPHAVPGRVDRKDVAAIRFADEVVQRLVREIRRGHVVRYSIVAAPRFMGHLRKALQKHKIDGPAATLSKDLVGRPAGDIETALQRV